MQLDTVTYRDPAVASYVGAHFLPVKLSLSDPADAAQARALVPLWTPTVVIGDGRGREVHREVGYLPPADFAPMLAVGLAKGLLATARGDEALRVLDEAVARYPSGEYAPQLLYWRGAIGDLVRGDPTQLETYWGRLQREFPDSTWRTRRGPFEPNG